MSKHWHHDRSQLNGVDKHEETAVQEEKASDTSVPRFLSDGINSEETAAKPSDGPTTIITVASSPMPQAPVVHKEKPQSNEPSMHGRVHVYEEGPGTAISLDLYARVFIKERDDNSLKLQCEMCTDPSFADPHTLIVLPKITLPKALFEEHENFLIFRLSQSSPMKKEYTFRINKKAEEPFSQHTLQATAATLNAELNAANATSPEVQADPDAAAQP